MNTLGAHRIRRLGQRARSRLTHSLAPYGLNLRQTRSAIRGRRQYRRNRAEFAALRAASPAEQNAFAIGRKVPCLTDRYASGGDTRGHYFHQDLYVAQLIKRAGPRRHVDVGSRVDGFVAHVASFRDIDVLDIRHTDTTVPGITFHTYDLMSGDGSWDARCDSLSCLHSLEHFGLGRYGDTIDLDGWRKGWDGLVRVVEPGGTIYLSTVIGPQRIEFDAHRVFELGTIIELVSGSCEIIGFAYIDDAGDIHRDVDWSGSAAASSFGCQYGCAILTLRRNGAEQAGG